MTESIVVTAMSAQTALGGLEFTWRSLLNAQSGIRSLQPYLELPMLPMAMLSEQPCALEELVQRLVKDIIEDSGLPLPWVDCPIVVGSSRGNQRVWEALKAEGSLQIRECWLDSLPNRAATLSAYLIGSRSEVQAPMAACSTGVVAIAQGLRLLELGICDRVLVGAVESPITRLTLAGFQQMGALAKTGAYPFDRDREGFVLGEGGALLLLERESIARDRGAKIYGKVLGFGMTADAYHLSAPEPTGEFAKRAIDDCLTRSQLVAKQIGYIHAHGTATRLNDQRESELMTQYFPQAAVSSTKGATGHTLGASGAIGAVLCLKALSTERLPPCVGLRHPENEAIDWVRQARHSAVNAALCLSFGFGGQNGAIALGKA